LSGLVSRLLVPGLSGAEIWDRGQAVAIHPDEIGHVAGSAEKRRRDFALGRSCARAALAQFGHADAVIAKHQDGGPVWPPGIVGSITHTSGYAAALAGECRHFAGLGIDAERTGGVTPDLWPRLFTPIERETLRTQADPLVSATLLFSAKEASYKALTLKAALVFREVEISLRLDGFVAAAHGASLGGRYALDNGVVLAAAWRTA